MSNLKRLLLDQPISSSSVDRACWWIDYVLRHDGTKHLKSTMKNLTWSEYLLIDVVVAMIVMFAATVCSIAFAIQRLRVYSKSLPFEMVTRGSKKCKVL
jgi:glucuronosyltransferase